MSIIKAIIVLLLFLPLFRANISIIATAATKPCAIPQAGRKGDEAMEVACHNFENKSVTLLMVGHFMHYAFIATPFWLLDCVN
jgi:hypothetical protein